MSVKQRVEGVEKFFLRTFLPAQELNVVDQKQVGLAVTLSEFDQIIVLDRVDEFINEQLAREIDHLGIFLFGHHVLANRLHQVRLSESYAAVNEKRVVSAGRRL